MCLVIIVVIDDRDEMMNGYHVDYSHRHADDHCRDVRSRPYLSGVVRLQVM